jgi:hypothetical protein
LTRQRRAALLSRQTIGLTCLAGLTLARLTLPPATLLRRTGLLALSAGDGARLLLLRLTRTVLLPRLTGPVLARLAGPAGLPGLADRPVRIDEVGIGLAERAPLLEHAAAERLGGVHLADKPLVALQHLRRDGDRHRGKARAACAGTNGKTARALAQKAEPRAGAIVDLDAADAAVGIGIKLDVDVVRTRRGGACGHLDQPRRAANAKRGGRRRDLHVAGFRHL